MLIILYGPPGAGKNHIGEWLQKHYDFYFYDADLDLTDEMRASIHNKQPFNQQMRDDFFDQVIDQTKHYLTKFQNVVLAQAISQVQNRKQLQRAFPAAHFVHINVDYPTQVQRLQQRNDWISPDMLNILLSIQAPADPAHDCIDNSHNNNDDSLKQQFNALFQRWL